jgi:hypothetical protein
MEKQVVNEELSQFLLSYFHQDIGTIDDSIRQFLSENGNEYIEEVVTVTKAFIADTTISTEAKNNFIKSSTSVNFLALEVSPLSWLTNLIDLFDVLKAQMG